MRKYERPELVLVAFNQCDVVRTSGVEGLAEVQDTVLFKDTF